MGKSSSDEMLIFRLENNLGHGVYQHNSYEYNPPGRVAQEICCELIPTYEDGKRCPVPSREEEDLGKFVRQSTWDVVSLYHYGFADLSQFLRWFPHKKARGALADAGVRLSLYKVPSAYVKVGSAQVAFRRDKATLVEKRCPVKCKALKCASI